MEVALAVPLRGGAVLLRPRPRGGSLAGRWEFPGGRIEPGEDALAAARRELREETGLRGERWEPLLVHLHAYADVRVRLHAFLLREPLGSVTEGTGWRWVSLPMLRDLPLPAANGPIVHALGRAAT